MVSWILLAVALSAPPRAYDLVTKECHATRQLDHGAPVLACEYRVWLVGMSKAACKDSRARVKAQIRGEVAANLEFLCLPEDDI